MTIELKFETWLAAQQHRDDFTGDLARALSSKTIVEKLPTRKHNEHSAWVNIVVGIGQPVFIQSFNDAWREYVAEKQRVEDVDSK